MGAKRLTLPTAGNIHVLQFRGNPNGFGAVQASQIVLPLTLGHELVAPRRSAARWRQ